jgi:para-aminobenzoate synthetase component 1
MGKNQRTIKMLAGVPAKPSDFSTQLPANFPICYFGGNSRFEFLATAFSEFSVDEFLAQTVRVDRENASDELPFKTGFVGVIPYLDPKYASPFDSPEARIYRVNESLVWDHLRNETYRCGARSSRDRYVLPEEFMSSITARCGRDVARGTGLSLRPARDATAYMRMIDLALEDIRSGRFYQINLLRYFQVDGFLDRHQLLRRIRHFGGPFSLLFQFPDYTVASLSPERFVQIMPDGSFARIVTQPIKGTVGRCQDPVGDRLAATELQNSLKNNSELHIIVDLMRNDLNRICARGTVAVSSPGKVVTYSTIHHLVAEITGQLRPDLSFKEIFSKILPGGSITGAPKVEVMSAIHEYEGRNRGLFMGNGFFLDDSGHFDSSILIRTLLAGESGKFEYAAGSGIVIGSDAQSEYDETEQKCRVITESVPDDMV